MLQVKRNIYVKTLKEISRLLLKNKRCFSTQRTYEEIRIPGPWGNVKGKWWGPQDKRPILGLHGWQDNCGTFDTLAPLLPPHVGFLAIDMPGHGWSSQLPPGTFYHGIDISTFIRRTVQYFGWPKVSIIAHSMGAINSFIYTMLYPETVDFLVCLDALYPIPNPKNTKAEGMAKTIDDFIKYDALNTSDGEPPSYTFAELEKLLHKGSRKSISLEACKYILRRNIAPSKSNPDRFYFTRDTRLKVASLIHWDEETIIEGCQRITCPVFLSMGKDSPLLMLEKKFLKVMEEMKKQNNNIEYHLVEGTHHLHLNTPENVKDLVNDFIRKHDKEDRSIAGWKEEMRVPSS